MYTEKMEIPEEFIKNQLKYIADNKELLISWKIAKDGEEIIIGDGAEEFARAVVDCLEDRDLSKRIGVNGRLLVEKYYRWEELGKRYDN